MQSIYFITSGVAALIAIMLFTYLRIRFPKAAGKTLILSFIFGFSWVFVAILAEYVTIKSGIAPSYDDKIRKLGFYSLVMAGFAREFGKYIIMRILLFGKNDFRTATDGIVYAVFIGLGFSMAYLIWSGLTPYTTDPGNLRAYLTIPVNLVTAIIIGFFVGVAKSRNNLLVDSMTGLGAATLFHGFYEFSLLTRDESLQIMFFTGSLIIAAILIYKAFSFSRN